MTEGTLLGLGTCYVCAEVFAFNPDTVPSVPIDPDTGLPPDVGRTEPANAIRRPICDVCLPVINKLRAGLKLPPFTHGKAWPNG